MQNQNPENNNYMNFIENLNEILTNYDISQLNCS